MNPLATIPIELNWLWSATWQAAVLAALVLIVQWLGRNRLSPSSRFILWWLVVIRLCLPMTPESAWSLFNLAPQRPVATTPIVVPADPTAFDPVRGGLIPAEVAQVPSPWAWSGAYPVSPGAAEPAPSPGTSEFALRSGTAAGVFSLLFWIWLLGAVSYAASLLLASVALGRHLRRQPFFDQPAFRRLLDGCRQQMGTQRELEIIETPRVQSPALFGLLRPRLLLPPGFLRDFSPAELRHVLLHELAHLRRGDLLLNWVMVWAQALHWFNPLVWLLFARIRSDRELACDALAMENTAGSDRATYAQTVLKLLERCATSSPLPGSVGVLEDRRGIERRIQSIVRFRPTRPLPWVVATVWIVLAALTLTDARPSAADQERPATFHVAAVSPAGAEDRAAILARHKLIDRENLRKIFVAIQGYQQRHGELPDWLSDLYPDFLTDPDILVSPEERLTGRTRLEGNPDPRMRTSYIYEFNANPAPADHVGTAQITYKQWKTRQMDRFGGAVPLVRCILYDPTLNLAVSGDIYESELFWERDPNTLALMQRLGVGTTLAGSPASGALALTVIGSHSDELLEGVRVRAWLQSEEGLLPTQTWTTDRDGLCWIPLVGDRPRYGILRLSHPTHVSRELKWHDGDVALLPRRIRIQMEPAFTINGTVRDNLSQPVADARLRFTLHNPEQGITGWTESNIILEDDAEIRTDVNGGWTFAKLPLHFAQLNIQADHPNYRPQQVHVPPVIVSGRDLHATSLQTHIEHWASFKLRPIVQSVGQILAQDGRPLPGALVSAQLGSNPQFQTLTDLQGRYRVILPDDGDLLVVTRDGSRPTLVEIPEANEEIVTVLQPAEPLRIRVVDLAGKSLPGVAVFFQSWSGPRLDWRGETGPDGSLTWTGAPEHARYNLARAGYRDVHRLELTADGTIHEVTLEPAFRVRGTVTDAVTGAPIPRFAIVRGTSRGTANIRWDLHRVPLGTGGQFETEFNEIDVNQTHGYVEIEADGYVPRRVGPMPMVDVEVVDVAVELTPLD